jgi:sugar lactone lactonase YvrE
MIVQSNIQTLGKFIGDGSALTNLPNSGNSASFSNLTAPFIYNSSLQTSSIMASTITVNGNTSLGGIPLTNTVVTTLAGSDSSAFAEGAGTNASFRNPNDVAVASDGTIYVADTENNRIRKVTPDGVVTTLAGSGVGFGSGAGSADGTGTNASFVRPRGVSVGPDGNIYVADTGNNCIRKVTPDGLVTTLAGGIQSTAFNGPQGIAVAPDGTIYVADSGANRIRKMIYNGTAWVVTTLAGSGAFAFSDGTGTNASFSRIKGITIAPDGTIYVADPDNNRIRIVTSTGVVTTLAGSGTPAFSDGTGSGASFSYPDGVAVAPDGNIYVADTGNNRIRKVNTQRVVTTLAGSGVAGFADGNNLATSFSSPRAIAIGPDGNIYVGDIENQRIRKIVSGLLSVNIVNIIGNLDVSGNTNLRGGVNVYGNVTVTSGRFIGDGSGLTGITNTGTTLSSNPTFSNVTVISNLYVPFIYNSSLQTSSIMASTIIASSITASTIATSTLSAYSMIVQSNIQTLGRFIGDGSFLTNLPYSGNNASFSNLTAPFIYNSSLQTSSIMASTIIASSITASTIATSTLSAYSMIVQNIETTSGIFRGDGSGLYNLPTTGASALFNIITAPFIYNSSLQTSSIMASTIIASSITTSTIATSTLSAYTVLVNGNTTLGGVPWSNNVVTRLAGSGTNGFADGIGTSASFNGPRGVAVGPDGTIYIADMYNNLIRKVTPQGVVTTLAGSGSAGFVDASGVAASFNFPRGIALGPDGNIYVADTDNHRIRKVTPEGVVTSLAGSGTQTFADGTGTGASFNLPNGLTIGPDGNIYVADTDNHRIRKLTPQGVVTTLAGSGTATVLGDNPDGTGTNASFCVPRGLVIGKDGNIYVADSLNHRIRKVTPGGVVTTLAGSGSSGSLDGTGTNTRFRRPAGVAIGQDGSIYVADTLNNTIRKVTTPGGVVTTFAGFLDHTGNTDGTGTNALFMEPCGVAVGPDGNIYVADTDNNLIRKIDSGFSKLDMLGNAYFTNYITAGASVNVDGGLDVSGNTNLRGGVNAYGTSMFSGNVGIGKTNPAYPLDISGSIYASGTLTVNSNIEIISGRFIGDGSGLSNLNIPNSGNTVSFSNLTAPFIYNSSLQTSSIMASTITVNGNTSLGGIPLTNTVVTTLAGSDSSAFAEGAGTNALFRNPNDVAVASDGSIYVVDTGNNRIRKIIYNGTAWVVTTLAGSGVGFGSGAGSADGTGTNALFNAPRGIAMDPDGNIYVADTNNSSIRKVTTGGVVTTLAGGIQSTAFNGPRGIAVAQDGTIYVADTENNRIRKMIYNGTTWVVTTLAGSGTRAFADGTGTAASFYQPCDLVLGPDGNIYVADTNNCRIRKVTNPGGVVTTLAGSGSFDFADGTGTAASFLGPEGITMGPDGSIYVADTFNNRIRKVTFPNGTIPNEGVVTTFAGSGASEWADGNLSAASFYEPKGVAIGSDGSIYVADTVNNRIRKIVSGSLSVNIVNIIGNLDVSVNTNLRGQVNAYGNVGIGKANPTSPLDVSGNITASGNINASGTVTSSSDIRIKTNIVKIDSPLEKISNMRGVYYNRIDDSNANPARHVGVIAQEIESVFPEVVSTDNSEEKNKSVAYGNIVALLIEAVKAQQSTIDSLLNR